MYNNYILLGWPKCGNTSINHVFRSLDIPFLQHWDGLGNTVYQKIQPQDQIVDLQPNTAIALGTMGQIDMFDEYYKQYPNALYILNYRPIRNYLISVCKHASIDPAWGWPITEDVVNHRIDKVQRHQNRVDEFFKHKPLLRLNIESPNWTAELTKSVTGQVVDIPNVHVNKRKVSNTLQKSFETIVDRVLNQRNMN